MKKLAVLILVSGLIFLSCKKKKSKTKDQEAPVIVAPVVVPDEFSILVNDTSFSCKGCSSSTLSTNSLRIVRFTNASGVKQSFNFDFLSLPKIGSYELREDSDPKMTYLNGSTYYKVTSGVLNITALDTSANGAIKKLSATFSAKTDTTLNSNYKIFKFTKGIISLDYK